MPAWWPTAPLPGNLGDILTPWMMRRDGVEPQFVGTDYCGKILGIGSILRWAQKEDEVWTPGFARLTDRCETRCHIRALRGPITAELCGILGRVPLGDGALCLPRYYSPAIRPTVKLLGIAHYVDWPHPEAWPAHWHDENAKVITTLTTDVEGFIDQILSAERVESSSLHGAVVAAAYGIPWKFLVLGDRLCGDGTKQRDFELGLAQANVDDLMATRPWINPIT